MSPVSKSFLPYLAFSSILCLVSCSDESLIDSVCQDSDLIEFAVGKGWTDTATSRAASTVSEYANQKTIAFEGELAGGDSLFLHIEETDMDNNETIGSAISRTILRPDELFSDLSVSAFKYKAGEWDESQTPDFISNMKLSYVNDNWVYSGNYMWPGAAFGLRFFGVSPYDSGTLSSPHTPGYPTLDYTVPEDIADQKSILTYFTDEIAGNDKKTVQIKLNHATASIILKETDDLLPGKIKSINLRNFYSSGTFDYGTGQWINLRGSTDYTQTIDKKVTGISGEEITDYLTSFTVLPQELQESAALEIVYVDDFTEVERVLTAPLKGRMEAGKMYCFYISSSSFRGELTFTLNGSILPKEGENSEPVIIDMGLGGIKNVYITSKFRIYEHGKVFRTDVLNSSQWNFKIYQFNNATGEYDIETPIQTTTEEIDVQNDTFIRRWYKPNVREDSLFWVYLKNNDYEYWYKSINEELKQQPERGSDSKPYNLANATGEETVENTANCYIINAPGTYSIPIVYGNTIKDGVFNERCIYSTNNATGWIATAFAGRKKNASSYEKIEITRPYICDLAREGVSPQDYITGADILWQDADNLITDLQLSDDRKSLVFKVNQSTITQGNALITVTENGTSLWSWHIWVTNYQPGQGDITLKTPEGNVYHIMPSYLGWVDKREGNNERTCKIVLWANGSRARYVAYLQQRGNLKILGHAPSWQWGCPAPVKPWPDGKTTSTDVPSEYTAFTAYNIESILCNPTKLYYISSTTYFQKNVGINLWNWGLKNKGMNNDAVIKSIYDPCPIGYSVPNTETFTSMFEYNVALKSYRPVAVNDKATLNGYWEYYCDASKKEPGNTIIFPIIYAPYAGSSKNIYGNTSWGTWVSGFDSSTSKDLGYIFSSTGSSSPYGIRTSGLRGSGTYVIIPMQEQ